MKHRIIGFAAGALVAALVLAPAAYAQDSAPGLQDLVGVRGSSGEEALRERGYKFAKGENVRNADRLFEHISVTQAH